MTTSGATMNDNRNHDSGGRSCGFGASANWSFTNIAFMVFGFVLFWPLGLFMLYWIMKGRDVVDIRSHLKAKWNRFKGNDSAGGGTDNQVFNEYQETQYDRIREIKEEIKERARRFTEFRADAKRRADEDEFRRFMDDTPDR